MQLNIVSGQFEWLRQLSCQWKETMEAVSPPLYPQYYKLAFLRLLGNYEIIYEAKFRAILDIFET